MESVSKAIGDKEARIAVIGLGYVGLTVACAFAQAGFQVIGVERDRAKAARIGLGLCPIGGREPGLADLLGAVTKSGKMQATTDYGLCGDAHVALIAVETPVDSVSKKPSYEALRAALSGLGSNLRPETLVVIESTIAPHTMERVVKPLLETRSGLKAGEGFQLAYCPERVIPGKLLDSLRTCNRVIGGMSAEASALARELYQHIVESELDVTDCFTAELVKTAENAYRDVQIAFANEIALLCENVGADVYEVRRLVNQAPYRAMHMPGAGVGGHCIPKDPWLLFRGAQGRLEARLIPTARAINDDMPLHMAELAQDGLQKAGGSVKGAKATVLGYAYLENSGDARNSPTIPLVERLRALGVKVKIHDPHFAEYNSDLKEAIAGSDCLIVMVAHDEYRALDLAALREWVGTPVLIDGRNVFDKGGAQDLGFVYKGVGNC
jgi:UDP-N-acetyl-D-mannosaminuronic acid dehydrogenase